MKHYCQKEQELSQIAEKLLVAFPDSRIFAFYGSMGAGKTTFIRYICEKLNVTDIVQSPTFSIMNEYRTSNGESIFHFDFYRINKIAEVFDLGYEEFFHSGSRCLIEWPEMVEELLPEGTVKVVISGDAERLIEF